ncbi:MAG: hypothetical protein AAFO69_14400, partial [Bacteroidota bacterium]
MRLSQLARKLGTTQSEIIRFVQEKQPDIGFNAHTRLDDETVDRVRAHFDPTGEKFQESTGSGALETTIDSEEVLSSVSESDEVIAPAMEDLSEQVIVEDLEEAKLPITGPVSVDESVTQEADSDAEEISTVPDLDGTSVPGIASPILNSEESSFNSHSETPVENEQNKITSPQVTDDRHFEQEGELESHNKIETNEVDEQDSSRIDEQPEASEENLPGEEEEDISYAELQAARDSEIIRAKLVKLEGIKVVGKIDLPPPPKPKEKTEEAPKDRQREIRQRDGRRRNKRKQPLSLKEKQERDKKREERAKLKKEKEAKEKKKRHYIER